LSQLEEVLAEEERAMGAPCYQTLGLLGYCTLNSGDLQHAETWIDSACARYDSTNPPILFVENPFLQKARLLELRGAESEATRHLDLGFEAMHAGFPASKWKTWQSAGHSWLDQRDFDHGEWCYRLAQYLSDRDPWRPYSNIGDMTKLYRIKGDTSRAKQFAELAFNRQARDPVEQGWTIVKIARLHLAVLDLDAYVQELRRAVDWAETISPPDEFLLHGVRLELGHLLHARGEDDEANRLFAGVANYLRTRKSDKELFGPYTEAMLIDGELSATDTTPDLKALEAMLNEIRAHQRGERSAFRDLGDYLHVPLGKIRDAQGRTGEALSAFRSYALSRDYWDAIYLEGPELRVLEILKSEGRLDEAEQFLRELLAKADKELAPIHPRRAIARQRLAEFLIEQKQEPERAIKVLEEARDNFKQHAIVPARRFEEIDALIARTKDLQSK
jgi:tetratricopeptide (TPR) repeat protein